MNEMVEKAARAMHAKDRVKMAASWGDTSEGDKWGYLTMARAAIEAMRDPTPEMEVAGTEQWLCEAAMEDRSGANWRAMIDAALKEG